VYFPNLHESGAGQPTIAQLGAFALAYLGSPLAALIDFPFINMFDIPTGVTARNMGCGAVLVFVTAAVLLMRWRDIRVGHRDSLLFIACAVFAIGSALLTGWGRAEMQPYGVANANASRYVLFSSYLLYGFLYAVARPFTPSLRKYRVPPRAAKTLLGIMIVALVVSAARSYAQGTVVYRNAHDFNRTLAEAFDSDTTNLYGSVYPNADTTAEFIHILRSLQIGPYRFVKRQRPDDASGAVGTR
jgi:hypothetical protein